jgi:hypothetical protein
MGSPERPIISTASGKSPQDRKHALLEADHGGEHYVCVETTFDTLDGTEEINFAAWMVSVNAIVSELAGCGGDSIADIDYRTLFEAKANPYQVANTILLHAGLELVE